ncbi:MAG: hypothetical protein SFW67_09240 [Myxococcaceae bacterium]|nr:hypothetical protein [Myxococcaceae bacterium]
MSRKTVGAAGAQGAVALSGVGASRRIAAKLQPRLPKLDARRRALYLGQFTDAQCHAWGSRTWARAVLGDAERALGVTAKLLDRCDVPGYPKHRLAWLCELVIALDAAIAEDDLPSQKLVRIEAKARAAQLDPLRRRLVSALQRLAPADMRHQRRVAAVNDPRPSPQGQYQTLEALAVLARAQRSTADRRLLADDCGLTEALIAQAEAEAEALRPLVAATWGNQATNDSMSTSAIEGRVLRELAYLHDALATARAEGLTVDTGPLPRTVRIASRRR